MSAESPRHVRSGGPLTVPSRPPSDRSIIDAVSGFINDVTLSSSSTVDPKDVIQWARFETADINEPTPEGDSDNDISPLLLILGYGSGVQVWLIPPTGEAQEVLSWRQGTVRVLRILPTPQRGDCFASKRPLIALCDSASPGPTFCSLSFISIRGGEQVKSIKFKNPILDVLANKRSVVVSFSERFAVFDAATLEDRMAVTTCYPCPCPLGGSSPINPLALGDRWLAYADKKLNQSKRSSGGCEAEGVTSYTATVLHAAKSLGKGLRGLGESVAHSLAGGRATSQSPSPPNVDVQQPGVVTVLDIEGPDEEDGQEAEEQCDPLVAHFVAHSDAIIALKFDASGLLLVTADRRGHDFHVFRLNPHPCGPSLASVHHLYVLHRGDTTAKVQDIAISMDSRWAAVSTLRGTTHVFAVSPYGGAAGVRTHSQPRVVNRLSRFHRSAGLPIHAPPAHAHPHAHKRPSGSPVGEGAWFPNPRLPPYPRPTTAAPLAQLRPSAALPTHTITRTSAGRQRLSSLSEDSSNVPLLARARFGPVPVGAGAGVGVGVGAGVGAGGPPPRAAAPVAALYLMAADGSLLHLLLHPRPLSSIPKEKICDESPIELEVEPIAQWPLQRPAAAGDLLAPLPPSNPLLQPLACRRCADICMSEEERWLSQVEIVTHAGPHRRLWMGPQFVFKTYNLTGSSSSLSEADTVEVDTSAARGAARSNPVNMPGARPLVPLLIDSGSASSLEHSPSDSNRRKSLLAESGRATSVCDVQLKEDLAEAMKEDQGCGREGEGEGEGEERRRGAGWRCGVERAVGPLGSVVAARGAGVPAPLDPDADTSSNCDEATFRPVVRAPAALPLDPELLVRVRPLPSTTTIPVQTTALPPPRDASPPPDPYRDCESLTTAVVIPAELTEPPPWTECDPDRDGLPDDRCATEPIALDTFIEECVSDERQRMDARCSTEAGEHDSPSPLPKSNRASDDIQPVSRPRVKKSPTPDERISELSSKSKKLCKIKDYSRSRDGKNNEDVLGPTEKKVSAMIEAPIIVERKRDKKDDIVIENDKEPIEEVKLSFKIEKDIQSEEECIKNEIITVKEQVKLPVEREKENESKEDSVKSELVTLKDDIVLCVKPEKINKEKSIFKEVKLADKFDILVNTENKRDSKEISMKTSKGKKISAKVEKVESQNMRASKDTKRNKELPIKIVKDNLKEISIAKNIEIEVLAPVRSETFMVPQKAKEPKESAVLLKKNEKMKSDTIENNDTSQAAVSMNMLVKMNKETVIQDSNEIEIKTEDQAWDMLLNEPDRPIFSSNQPIISNEKVIDESKSKSKKNRKAKKSQEDTHTKAEEDSFVEIHAIDDSQQPSSGDLVAISTPYEEIDLSTSYISKLKKPRSSKSISERKDSSDTAVESWPRGELELCSYRSKFCKENDDTCSDIEVLPEIKPKIKSKEAAKEKVNDILKTAQNIHIDESQIATVIVKESPNAKKSKSLSPYAERRKSVEKLSETEVRDVYVIDSTQEEFPEIQITKGSKLRKKSPHPVERKNQEKETIVDKSTKSWSSIAASKSVKKIDDIDVVKAETLGIQSKTIIKKDESIKTDEDITTSCPSVSLQEKLIELCKRTDIMVAECDAPSELNFVEEHHLVSHDLPPLEPLDFALDDFNIEVMRDSLLDVNDSKTTSPCCKIDIDSILSTIKETSKVDSCMFNLIDLEKVTAKREKGFSVVENVKMTTQVVKLEDEGNESKEIEVMEKSSDDDIASPVLSADSDKEEKKTIGASNLTTPSSKQSAKSKKSRKKKK